MGIVYAGIAAEAAIGRHEMRGIAGDEDAPVAELARDIGRGAPARHAVDLAPGKSGTPAPARTELDELRFADIGGGIRGGHGIELGIANRIDDEKAPPRGPVHAEEAADSGC